MAHWSENFNTYKEACAFYGAEDPDYDYEAEFQGRFEENCIEDQDDIEVHGPRFREPIICINGDEIPF